MIDPPDISDPHSATQFVLWCVEQLGLGYHPDNRFADYVDPDGRPTFTSEEAARLDALNGKAFAHIDPYEVGLTEFRRRMAVSEEE